MPTHSRLDPGPPANVQRSPIYKMGSQLILFLFLIIGSIAHAYPDFIAYGYTTCIVCHYNSQGGGPLTDYGRALFSQEIAARPFIPDSVTDDELADKSNFIPGHELPYWIRPSLKYRGLWVETDPHGSKTVDRWINMQQDGSLVFAFDQNQRTIVSMTYGFLPERMDYYSNGREYLMVSREYYVRFYYNKNLMIAAGLMDKVYGLRTGDHTMFSRETLGLGENDAVDGVLLEYSESKYDLNLHMFAGDLMKAPSERQRGFSLMGEYEIADKNRIGASYIVFETDIMLAQRLAAHDRWGLPDYPGSSVMGEAGFKRDTNHFTLDSKNGIYAMFETLIRLARGYNILATAEQIQNDAQPSAGDMRKIGLGVLTFPFQRTEVRASVVRTEGLTQDTNVPADWMLMTQLHLSL